MAVAAPAAAGPPEKPEFPEYRDAVGSICENAAELDRMPPAPVA